MFKFIPLSLCAHSMVSNAVGLTHLRVECAFVCVHCTYACYLSIAQILSVEKALSTISDSVHTFAASFDFLVDSQRRDEHTELRKSMRVSWLLIEENLQFITTSLSNGIRYFEILRQRLNHFLSEFLLNLCAKQTQKLWKWDKTTGIDNGKWRHPKRSWKVNSRHWMLFKHFKEKTIYIDLERAIMFSFFYSVCSTPEYKEVQKSQTLWKASVNKLIKIVCCVWKHSEKKKNGQRNRVFLWISTKNRTTYIDRIWIDSKI